MKVIAVTNLARQVEVAVRAAVVTVRNQARVVEVIVRAALTEPVTITAVKILQEDLDHVSLVSEEIVPFRLISMVDHLSHVDPNYATKVIILVNLKYAS